ncbi:hypothetical protein OIU77_014027 [Salix suchowensis]|uniref:GDSL esterase/lipase n=1 Tax=Salix suchowensis TaxID=1278906 RepID=A0ABQ8ZW71_9ROSI|nr:hypothetical protein OIU77_014027 [Salix suchowensis]KAJ6312414.1 hypothetical protein OIU77_014027 [Salix suchowensis]
MKLSKLQSQLHGSFFVHTDTFRFLQELKENKEKYGNTSFSCIFVMFFICVLRTTFCSSITGITDTQNACWEGKHDPCPERDRYIYFDSAHPSRITNSIFATRCFNESSICTPMNNIMQLVSAGAELHLRLLID